MANIALSSSVIATSNIVQNQAQFAFPIDFPFIFNIQNLTENIGLTAEEGTTNVVTNTNLNTGWSQGYCAGILWNDISPPDNIISSVVSFYDADTDKSAYWYSYGNYSPQVPNTVYTVSMYIKTNDSNFRIAFYTADNSELGRYWGEVIIVPNDGNWHRVAWNSFLNPANSQSDSLSFHFNFGNAQGESQRTWFCAPQMEAKDHATPFTVGTRAEGRVLATSSFTGQLLSIIPISCHVSATANLQGTISKGSAIQGALTDSSSIGTANMITQMALTAIEGTTNLWSGAFTVYNNYAMPNTKTLLSEYYLGQQITRVSITPDSTCVSDFQTALHSHGVYGSYRTYKAYTTYAISVYWRPITYPTDMQVGLTASNIGGWISGATTAIGDGWYRTYAYRDGSVTTDKTDNIFFSFKSSLAIAGTPIYVDWVCPQIEEGMAIPTPFTTGTRSEGRILAGSTLAAQTIGKMTINSQSLSITSLAAQNTSQMMINGQISPSTALASQLTFGGILSGQLLVTLNINSQIKVQSFIVPQTINATATVIGIPTATFKAVTNIVANTSNAGTLANQEGVQGNLIISTNISGTLCNLISSDMNSESSIEFPQTFDFPFTFPFTINDKVQSNVSISVSVTETSLIVNSGILNLLNANIQANSNITSNATCTLLVSSTMTVTPNISAKITSVQAIGGQSSNVAAITGQIEEIINLVSSIGSSLNFNGNLTVVFNPLSNIAANNIMIGELIEQISISGNVVGSSNLSSNLTQIVKLLSSSSTSSSINNVDVSIDQFLVASVNVNETINSTTDALQIGCQGDLTSSSTITGDACLLMGCLLEANINIILPETFGFPLNFPFVFMDGAFNAVEINAMPITVDSLITGNINCIISAEVQSSSLISGVLSDNLSLHAALTAITNITEIIIEESPLSGAIQANPAVSATMKTINQLSGNCSNTSMLSSIANTNVAVIGQITTVSLIQATIANIYFISLIGDFGTTIKAISTIPFNNLISTDFVNLVSIATLQSAIHEDGIMQSLILIEGILNCNQSMNIVSPCFESEHVLMSLEINEMDAFNANVNRSQTLNLLQSDEVQFTNILIRTKF